jgi:hypothetical protein
MRRKAILEVLYVSLLLAMSCRAQETEQRTFGAEEALQRPVQLPDEVLSALGADESVRTCIAEGNAQQTRKEWFGASRIDLNSDDRTDLVIVPVNGCLFGANLLPFWVFHNTEAGYVLALSTTGLGLEVLEAKTQGYSDIEVSAVVGMRLVVTLTYKFNGSRYEQASRRAEEIK